MPRLFRHAPKGQPVTQEGRPPAPPIHLTALRLKGTALWSFRVGRTVCFARTYQEAARLLASRS